VAGFFQPCLQRRRLQWSAGEGRDDRARNRFEHEQRRRGVSGQAQNRLRPSAPKSVGLPGLTRKPCTITRAVCDLRYACGKGCARPPRIRRSRRRRRIARARTQAPIRTCPLRRAVSDSGARGRPSLAVKPRSHSGLSRESLGAWPRLRLDDLVSARQHGDRRAAVDKNVGNAEGGENAYSPARMRRPGFNSVSPSRISAPRSATFAPISMGVCTRSRLRRRPHLRSAPTDWRRAEEGRPWESDRRYRVSGISGAAPITYAGDDLEITRRKLRLKRKPSISERAALDNRRRTATLAQVRAQTRRRAFTTSFRRCERAHAKNATSPVAARAAFPSQNRTAGRSGLRTG